MNRIDCGKPFRMWAILIALLGFGSKAVSGSDGPGVAADPVVFNRDIRPILSDRCFSCHGNDAGNRKAKLRLDTRSGAHASVLIAGKPEESELYRRLVSADPDELMPPKKTGKELSAAEIETIRRWIAGGGVYQGHWAFEPPTAPPVPAVRNAGWAINEVDRFVLARMEAAGMEPSPMADRRTLIRRVTLDLTGLPPTRDAVRAFVDDPDPDAYERVVDRLLNVPDYGEHMTRFWLDAARYGDTHGLHLDNYREMWPYRDWVIRAFNANKPYDEFALEQLAGDLLPEPTLDQRVATGFIRSHVTTNEGGSIVEEVYVRNVVDRVETFGTVFMGLSIGCAVCHDHKFDPVTQKEFYQLFAFFNSLDGNAMDGNRKDPAPVARVPTAGQEAERRRWLARLAEVDERIDRAVRAVRYREPERPAPPRAPDPVETVWIDDAVPDGAKAEGGWQFVGQGEGPVFSGDKAFTRTASGLGQHFFTGASETLRVGAGDVLFAHVYLDPDNPPKEIMLQWNSGEWRHRAYWGENRIEWGENGTSSRWRVGDLPEPGRWARLEVPAARVGLKPGNQINGWAFSQFDGTTHWDRAGILGRGSGFTLYDSFALWTADCRGGKEPELPAEIRKLLDGDGRAPESLGRLKRFFVEHVYTGTRPVFDSLREERAELTRALKQQEAAFATTLVWKERDEPREAFLLKRGQYDLRGEPVGRATPAFLPPLPDGVSIDRLALARWLLRADHPLTARVTVNRLWQQVFGSGLVRTAADFGSQGEWPTHPALLDWLAVEFQRTGWDVKRFMRLLVTSSTYRQSSRSTPERVGADPANRLLARGSRFRLDAETLRDQALMLGGLLVEQVGGPAVKPPQPDGLWHAVGYTSSNTARFVADQGPAKVHRRSVYTFWKRTSPPPQMSLFDAPSREACTVRRERTNTPLQALLLLNDPQYFEAARHFAERELHDGGASDRERLAHAFESATARLPVDTEMDELARALADYRGAYRADPAAARRAIAVGELPPDADLDPVELAAWTLVMNSILNLDELVNRN